ncbi:hypothetical protein OBBRIDRAFT_251725 [Obba rivulosa]|uniref:Secreted protein n=1 Tax=Obba rivulosa TaxID=1052685 RepID=A0A8E2DQC0_9APHY|nr:hypothetical protein OBBRIDRAFT_251725 [Obba rivulosa]
MHVAKPYFMTTIMLRSCQALLSVTADMVHCHDRRQQVEGSGIVLEDMSRLQEMAMIFTCIQVQSYIDISTNRHPCSGASSWSNPRVREVSMSKHSHPLCFEPTIRSCSN